MPRKRPACTRSELVKTLMVLHQLCVSLSRFTTSSPSHGPLPKVKSLAFWLAPSFPPASRILTPIFPLAATTGDTWNLVAAVAVVLHFSGDTVVLAVCLGMGDHLQNAQILYRCTSRRVTGSPFSQKFLWKMPGHQERGTSSPTLLAAFSLGCCFLLFSLYFWLFSWNGFVSFKTAVVG